MLDGALAYAVQALLAGLGDYRAACRPNCRPDCISKIAHAEEEADESAYWLELLLESRTSPPDPTIPSIDEAGQLAAIMAAPANTARLRSTQKLRTAGATSDEGVATGR
jgi:hypothetical protein